MKLGAPQSDELGYAESLSTEDIGGTRVIVLQQPPAQGQICTVVLRGATDQLLDDLERAVDDGVNTYKVGAWPPVVATQDICLMEPLLLRWLPTHPGCCRRCARIPGRWLRGALLRWRSQSDWQTLGRRRLGWTSMPLQSMLKLYR